MTPLGRRLVAVLLGSAMLAGIVPMGAEAAGEDVYATASGGPSAGSDRITGPPDEAYAVLGDKRGQDLVWASGFSTERTFTQVALVARLHVSAPFAGERLELTYEIDGATPPGATSLTFAPAQTQDADVVLDVTGDRAWSAEALAGLKLKLKYLKAGGPKRADGPHAYVDALWVRVGLAHHLSADFTWAPDSPKLGETVRFEDRTNASHEIVSWHWDFGDGNTSNATSPTHAYARKGDHVVTLMVTDETGATSTATHTVSVPNTAPVASFNVTYPDPNALTSVAFDDTSIDPDGDIVRRLWEFGDGTTSEEASPVHTYPDAGPYEARLTVWDAEGANASVARTVAPPNQPPQASFSFSPSVPSRLDDVAFVDASSDEDGRIVAWRWDFGDGSGSTEASPVHRFEMTGEHRVRLEVTDELGGRAIHERVVTVVNLPPSADFSWQPDPPEVGLRIRFDDASTDRDGGIAAWSWSFGDGNVSTDASPVHRYAAQGTYEVALTVTDADGATATVTRALHVCPVMCIDVEMTRETFSMFAHVTGRVETGLPNMHVNVTVRHTGTDGTLAEGEIVWRTRLVTNDAGVGHFEVPRQTGVHVVALGTTPTQHTHEYLVEAQADVHGARVAAYDTYRVHAVG